MGIFDRQGETGVHGSEKRDSKREDRLVADAVKGEMPGLPDGVERVRARHPSAGR